MALSNWDTYSIDVHGEATNGVFTSFLGVRVEFYKNWLYVHDEKAWEEGAFGNPVVMEIQQGDLQYKDVRIRAIRGPKSGVFAVVDSFKYPTCEESRAGKEIEHRVMIGIGCYGFRGEEWVGIERSEIDFLMRWINIYSGFGEDIRSIALTDGLRFNQGDAYLAVNVGEEIPATEPGESKRLRLLDFVASSKSDDEEK